MRTQPIAKKSEKSAGEVLRECRGDRSQTAYAEFLGISQTQLSNYETGKDEPRLGIAFLIQKKTRGRVRADSWPSARLVATGTDG